MKSIFTTLTCLSFLFLTVSLNAQISTTSQWTWIKGDSIINAPGIYGSKGVAADSNKPGARFASVTWEDASGNFWLFGGHGYAAGAGSADRLNDLWKYNPATNQWTWINGSSAINQTGVYGTLGTPAATNQPGGRAASFIWTDTSGNFWLFGGNDIYGNLNDLWKYNSATNQWTWINGSNSANQAGVYGTSGTPAPANRPGARSQSVNWTDTSGNLWLFGGFAYTASGGGRVNDLWKYNPATNQWTWINGSNLANQAGIYGTLGIPAAANRPGARDGSVNWTDTSGNFWLFGGFGYAANGVVGTLNDLWKYNSATNQWIWINGSNSVDQAGVYGTLGTPAPANRPGARGLSVSWTDVSGNFWLFGGAANNNEFTDLWKYNPATNQWTWMNGPNLANQAGIYGILGTPAPANRPGVRVASVSWIDAADNLWLFGGRTRTSTGSSHLSDLWKFGNTVVFFLSVNNGDWNTPSTWAGGVVPPSDAVVVVRHIVTVQTNTSCYSVKIEGPNGYITVKTGVQFTVLH